MASICLAHGSTFRGDKLIDCYTNKPFGRFHELMRTARAYVAPVFAAAPNEPTATPIQQYISLEVRNRVRAMLDAEESVGKLPSSATCLLQQFIVKETG